MIVYLTGDFYWRLYSDCDWLWNLPTFPSDTARWRRALQTQNADSVQSHQWSRRREGEMDEAEQGVCCSNQTSRWWVYEADTSRFCQILQLSVGLISVYSTLSFKLWQYYFITLLYYFVTNFSPYSKSFICWWNSTAFSCSPLKATFF